MSGNDDRETRADAAPLSKARISREETSFLVKKDYRRVRCGYVQGEDAMDRPETGVLDCDVLIVGVAWPAARPTSGGRMRWVRVGSFGAAMPSVLASMITG